MKIYDINNLKLFIYLNESLYTISKYGKLGHFVCHI
jgi:hypothetical protein